MSQKSRRHPHRFMGRSWTLYQRDVQELLAEPWPELYDGVLCDLPYGLSFMGKVWDKAIPPVEVWSQLLRACKPGAHLLAFSGPKTEHRLTCNIEDAGWEVRDSEMIGGLREGWDYVTGIERDRHFCEVAVGRLCAEHSQMDKAG